MTQLNLIPPKVAGFELTLRMDPPNVTHQAKQIIRPKGKRRAMLMDEPELMLARKRYQNHLMAMSRFRPASPLDGAIHCEVHFVFATPDRSKWGKRHIVKPDLDNAFKTLLDELVRARFILHDQRVCSSRSWKTWDSEGRILIKAVELSE